MATKKAKKLDYIQELQIYGYKRGWDFPCKLKIINLQGFNKGDTIPCKMKKFNLQGFMFLGRDTVLAHLEKLKNKNSASLVILKGRRRIGKSTLIQQYGKGFSYFYEFQGLAPREGMGQASQLENCAQRLAHYLEVPPFELLHWNQAFQMLHKLVPKNKSTLLFLDEISWMARGDLDFPGKLKIAWDTLFKHHPKLVVVLCGSVSAWIQKNILDNTGFMGRISLEINLEPLELPYCSKILDQGAASLSSIEKFKILSCIGGVPRYLEEIIPQFGAEKNIKDLFFDPSGLLFHEFDYIFSDIFEKRSGTLKAILQLISNRHLSSREMAEHLEKQQGGDLSESLSILEQSGFIERDFSWKMDGTISKLSEYRIKDLFLRFYLKYVDPMRSQIKKGIFKFQSLDQLLQWDSIVALQFENLILSHKLKIAQYLSIDLGHIVQIGRYFQTKTQVRLGCQIDLMIQTKYQMFYICEVKFKKKISLEVIKEVQAKIAALQKPRYCSFQAVLIYMGELDERVVQAGYFSFIISAEKLLQYDE